MPGVEIYQENISKIQSEKIRKVSHYEESVSGLFQGMAWILCSDLSK